MDLPDSQASNKAGSSGKGVLWKTGALREEAPPYGPRAYDKTFSREAMRRSHHPLSGA